MCSALARAWAPTPGGRDGGTHPPAQKFEGDAPPEIAIFTYIFKELIFYIIRDFQNKVAEI